MAERKDQMRIIRQDAGFGARLGFGAPVAEPGAGGPVATGAPTVAQPMATSTTRETVPSELNETVEVASSPVAIAAPTPQPVTTDSKTRKEERPHPRVGQATDRPRASAKATPSSSRGHVVYVGVSLTTRQAGLAETWADAARCSVQFLIRRVAQSLRGDAFDDWERDGMPEVHEPRGARGRHPTSVTLTLDPQFAASLSAKHDPLGILGLARIMGPAFRARFELAFDAALAKANIATVNEGDNE